jgi:hypothetical protein
MTPSFNDCSILNQMSSCIILRFANNQSIIMVFCWITNSVDIKFYKLLSRLTLETLNIILKSRKAVKKSIFQLLKLIIYRYQFQKKIRKKYLKINFILSKKLIFHMKKIFFDLTEFFLNINKIFKNKFTFCQSNNFLSKLRS